MKTIGLTGGVGCGKTAILSYMKKAYDARIIVADETAHLLEEPGQPCYNEMVAAFGTQILQQGKTGEAIDKQKFASLVFSDEASLQKVNEIIHPAVKEYILSEIEKERSLGRTYVIVEAALLLECGYQELLDEIWYVYADLAIRRRRLKESRGYTDARIDGILASQLSEEDYRSRCSRVIDNSGSLEAAKMQVDRYMLEGRR